MRAGGVLLAAREPLAARPPPVPVPWPERRVPPARRDRGPDAHVAERARPAGSSRARCAALRAGLATQRAPRCCAATSTRRAASARTGRHLVRPRHARAPAGGARRPSGTRPSGRRPRAARARLEGRVPRAARLRRTEPSWTFRAGSGGWRLDHVFCSPELRPLAATYHHGWREAGLSDHSALEADLAPGPG